jgi:predicted ribosomally synthesized peptide with nif11-like leader
MNKQFVDFMKKVSSSDTLKQKIRTVSDMDSFQKVAKSEGFSFNKRDIINFFSQQANAIKANLAGIDGNGALVFGRDWAYPGPDTDGNVIV